MRNVKVDMSVRIPWNLLLPAMLRAVEAEVYDEQASSVFSAWDVQRLRKMADLIEEAITEGSPS